MNEFSFFFNSFGFVYIDMTFFDNLVGGGWTQLPERKVPEVFQSKPRVGGAEKKLKMEGIQLAHFSIEDGKKEDHKETIFW